MAGAGLSVGQVIGTSSNKGETPKERPVGSTDGLATIYRHLGIIPSSHTEDRSGKPFPTRALPSRFGSRWDA